MIDDRENNMTVSTISKSTLWRLAAVLFGSAMCIYVMETIGSVPILRMTLGDSLPFVMFLVGQVSMIWGMVSPSNPKSSSLTNRLIDASPALLGSVVAGSYLIWKTGTSTYFLIALGIVAFVMIKVLLRMAWKKRSAQ